MKNKTAPLAVYKGAVGRIDTDALIIHSFGHRSWPLQQIDALYIHTRRLPFLRSLGIGCIASALWLNRFVNTTMPWVIHVMFIALTVGIIPALLYYRNSHNYLVLKGTSFTCRWEIPPRFLNECRMYHQIARQLMSHHAQCDAYGRHRNLMQPWFFN